MMITTKEELNKFVDSDVFDSMIYTQKSIQQSAGLSNGSLAFLHTHYQKRRSNNAKSHYDHGSADP